ncbi:MAG TPA: PEGA domain-containing protein [Thioploca sp.]|nr:PEGA domain-containing protein [Thioploca sp.]
MMHTHRNGFLQSAFYTLCLLGLSIQPLYADRCRLAPLAAGVPIALVIANSQYENGTLWQSVNDANAMKNVLTQIGFRVIFKTELNKRAMDKATREFRQCLQTTRGVGLFYFSGYGVQVNGENYLLPTYANFSDEADVEYDAFQVGKILDRLKLVKNDLNIIILDASREIPSLRTSRRGLANMSSPSGFFMAYPAKAGKTIQEQRGQNSLYVKNLVKVLKTAAPNHKRIEDVFMQVNNAVIQATFEQQMPIYNGSLKKRFCFGGCKKTRKRSFETLRKVKLTVYSNVEGATLFINGKNSGTIRNGKRKVKLRVGRRHTVRIEKSGYIPVVKSINLQSTQKIVVDLMQAPKPETRQQMMPSVGF